MSHSKPIVALGMSGGVDSSVAVYLLQQAGYEVHGIHMLMIPEEFQPNPAAVTDAELVAKQFGINFTVLDVREAFRDAIIKQFCEEYSCGRTPNPCVLCNKQFKFGLLADAAQKLHTDFISTGHYVRLETTEAGQKVLCKAADSKKDQSYFLSMISPAILEHCVFPLGQYTKEQVRQIAKMQGIAVAEKQDSQEICFIPDNDYKTFLKKLLPENAFCAGKIFYRDGSYLGTHNGIQNYTIGQRKGLGVALGKPAYVVALDAKKNQVILGESADLFHTRLSSSQNNYFVETPFSEPIFVQAKIRYRAEAAPAWLTAYADGTAAVQFEEPQRAITPGQCVSYYQGDILIGGGVIEQPE